MENVREQDVFLVQPTSRPVNDSIMELLIMIDAFKRASAGRITAVMPYYAYGRSDKKDQPRVPITARLVADMLTVAGADRVLTMDLHQGQIQGFFSIPVDELTAINILCRYIREKNLPDIVVVSASSASPRRRATSPRSCRRRWPSSRSGGVGNEDKTELMNIIGEVDGKTAVIIDDEIDTAGSLLEAVAALVAEGARAVYSCATHGVFSDKALEQHRGQPADRGDRHRHHPAARRRDPRSDHRPRRSRRSSARRSSASTAARASGALFSSEVQLVEEMTFWGSHAEDEDEAPAIPIESRRRCRGLSAAPGAEIGPDAPIYSMLP